MELDTDGFVISRSRFDPGGWLQFKNARQAPRELESLDVQLQAKVKLSIVAIPDGRQFNQLSARTIRAYSNRDPAAR